jgi:acyl dehydratase
MERRERSQRSAVCYGRSIIALKPQDESMSVSSSVKQSAAGSAPFDPHQHHMCPQRWFDDFKVGERFVLPSRTMTEALFAAFALASGDNHPIHYDVEFCRQRGMPHLLAHGFQVLIQTAAGAGQFPHVVSESLKAFLDQSSRFLAPVYAGDTLYSALEVTALESGRSTGVLTMASSVHNQRGELVMDGSQRYLLRKRP